MKSGLLLLLFLGPLGLCPPAAGLRPSGPQDGRPPPHGTLVTSCDNFCSTDEDCPGSERCRSTGCGRQCRLPAGAKRGFCPRLGSGLATICRVECGGDSECQGGEKCCSIGCHVRCVTPVPAKPGVCPKRRVLQTLVPCNSSCTDDSDCPRSEKCCFTGCSLGCLPPNRGAAGWGHHLAVAASNGPVFPSDICHLPPVPGPCRGRFHRYAYTPATGTCQPFIYSGCWGNPNNFRTVEECQQVCQQPGRPEE